MKARVKATGEIVEVAYHGLGVYVDMNKWDKEYNFDEIIILDNGDPDYWTRLEHQAAIAAMQGIMANIDLLMSLAKKKPDDYPAKYTVAEFAKDCAHALVEKMKEVK